MPTELPPLPERPNARTDEQVNGRTPERANTRTGEQVNTRTPEQANARTGEREITRQSYNVYTDQHMALKRLEAQASLNGAKPRTISEMVREAISDFLSKQPQP
jgi:succinyl-CoA synthetase alpha subunit